MSGIVGVHKDIAIRENSHRNCLLHSAYHFTVHETLEYPRQTNTNWRRDGRRLVKLQNVLTLLPARPPMARQNLGSGALEHLCVFDGLF